MIKAILFILCGFAGVAQAAPDVLKDFENLGGNKELLEKVKAVEPDKRAQVVQTRVVRRDLRFEIAPEVGGVLGGDSYLQTASTGLSAQFHINPYISVGARYSRMANDLSSEGKNLINESGVTGQNTVPDIDPPVSQTMAVVNLYPIYGKLNFFNKAVNHFDIYGQLGYGSIQLRSGSKNTWSAGAGVGFWWSQHLSTRLELLQQNFEAERLQGPAPMRWTVAQFQVGFLL